MSFTGVKCYICTSDVSWSHCESYQQAHTCPHIYDECLKLSKEEENTYSSKLFRKRCTSNKLCTAYNPTCEGPDVVKCDFSCCMGDLCNSASYAQIERFGVLMVSVWVLFLYSWNCRINLRGIRTIHCHERKKIYPFSYKQRLTFAKVFDIG